MNTTTKTATALVATLAAGGTLLATPALASEASSHRHAPRCVTHTDLTETSTLTLTDGGAPGVGAGDLIDFTNELRDASGALVATGQGHGVVYLDTATGKLMEFLTSTDVLPEGTVYAAGPVEVATAATGGLQSYFAVGVDGQVRGLVGTRTVQLVRRQSATVSIATSSFTLCRP